MGIWEVLKINATTESSIIKKAYAKQLKMHRPEDDPEGYQILREAFDNALKFAKNNHYSGETSNLVNVLNNLSEQNRPVNFNKIVENTPAGIEAPEHNICNDPHKLDILYNNVNEPEPVKYEKLFEDFFSRLQILYDDFFQRIEIKNWEEALNTDIMWHLNYKDALNKRMLEFLTEHNHLPKHIWQFLNCNFHWDEQKEYLCSCFSDTFIKYLFDMLSNNRCLRYCYFSKAYEIDFDKYIYYREQAFYALSFKNIKKAEHFVSLAYAMYPHDPELLCMKGECGLFMMNFKKAKDEFNAAILINPDDMDIRIYQAEIYYKYNEIKYAMSACNYIIKNKADNFEAKFLLGQCYMKRKKWYKASKIFRENLKLNPSDSENRRQLNLISNQLYKDYKKNKYNLHTMHNLKIVYSALGEYTRIKTMKLNLPYFIMKLGVYIFFLLVFILAIVNSILVIQNA